MKGIGTDIIEIDRIRKSIDSYGDHFLNKLFTEKEIAYCNSKKDPAIHFAARFCAKEAVVKALGTGFGKYIAWKDIEIEKDPLGKPSILLSSKVASSFKNPILFLSISHCKQYATAACIWE